MMPLILAPAEEGVAPLKIMVMPQRVQRVTIAAVPMIEPMPVVV